MDWALPKVVESMRGTPCERDPQLTLLKMEGAIWPEMWAASRPGEGCWLIASESGLSPTTISNSTVGKTHKLWLKT